MPKYKKTIFQLEVTDSEFTVRYTGELTEPQTKEDRKHNLRLMRALIANDTLLTFLYNIVNPVVRYKRREAAKKAKLCEQTQNSLG